MHIEIYTYVALAGMLLYSLLSITHALAPAAAFATSEYDSRKLSSSTGYGKLIA